MLNLILPEEDSVNDSDDDDFVEVVRDVEARAPDEKEVSEASL